MITSLRIRNFRSIKDQTLELAPLTILFGPNGAGKSSVLNALSIMRNVVANPNQPTDSFFNIGTANFGGYEQVVFEHDVNKEMSFQVGISQGESVEGTYTVGLGKNSGTLKLTCSRPAELKLGVDVSFPYPANKKDIVAVSSDDFKASLEWNGIVAQIPKVEGGEPAEKWSKQVLAAINSIPEEVKGFDSVNLMRGFSKVSYASVPLSPVISKEDEVATVLASDPYLPDRVSHYLERVLNHSFRVHVPLGTSSFWLKTTDRTSGISAELVNDGFGLNQVVFLLAKILRGQAKLVSVEEPEIHMHPSAQSTLVKTLVELAQDEGKQFVVSTHSEHIVVSALAAVAKGMIPRSSVGFYLCTKKKKETIVEKQTLSESGQLEGGLSSFLRAEMEDLSLLLQPSPPSA